MRSFFAARKGTVIVVAIVVVAVLGLSWFFLGFWADVNNRMWKSFTREFLQRGFFPSLNPFHYTKWFWLVGGLILIGIGYLLEERKRLVSATLGIVMLAYSVFTWAIALNDHSAAYAGSTTFVVEDADNLPSSLKRLGNDTNPDQNGCALYAYNDMRGCIQEGTFEFEWDARSSSATGALTVIKRSSSAASRTQLLESSLTYVYGMGEQGVWTAIRDGKSTQPIYGVLSYAGEGNVQICRFAGAYAMNKAFDGRWGKNLSDEIASKYPDLFYEDSDRYGYCDGDKPVIVIPVKEQVAFKTRTAFRSAGVLVITGSSSGEAQYQHVTTVKPGDFPGPVYPASLAKEQRETMGMIAGIRDSIFGKFGYEPTNVETQSGNASEYQLRDKLTGRVYWVTPMKSRSSDSQVLSAYTVVAADEATNGSLNEQRIYVLPDDDPRAVNLDDLEARTKEAISKADSGFYAAKGKLVEFLPLSGDSWQVYAELSGRVVYRIEVSTDARIRPTVFTLDTTSESEEEPEDLASACVEDLSSLSDKELASCLSDVADELEGRQN